MPDPADPDRRGPGREEELHGWRDVKREKKRQIRVATQSIQSGDEENRGKYRKHVDEYNAMQKYVTHAKDEGKGANAGPKKG